MKVIGILIALVVCIGLQIAAFGIAKTYGVQMDDAEDDNPVIEKGLELCPEFDKTVAFNNHSFVQIGLCVPFFGALIGVILQAKYFHGQRDKERRIVAPAKKTLLKGIGRFLVCVVLSLPWVLLVKYVKFEDNKWLNMLRYAIPFFGWNLTLTFLLDIVCSKLSMYDQKSDVTTVANTVKSAAKQIGNAINERD